MKKGVQHGIKESNIKQWESADFSSNLDLKLKV